MIYVVTETNYDYESTTTIILKAFKEKQIAEKFAQAKEKLLAQDYEKHLAYNEYINNFKNNHEFSKMQRPDIFSYTTSVQYKALSPKKQREGLSEFNSQYMQAMKKMGHELHEAGKKYAQDLGVDYTTLVNMKNPNEVSFAVEEVELE